jgi:hypothetical protein
LTTSRFHDARTPAGIEQKDTKIGEGGVF